MTALASSTSGLEAREPESVSDESESAPGEEGPLGTGWDAGVDARDAAVDPTRCRLFIDVEVVDGGDRFDGAISTDRTSELLDATYSSSDRQESA